MQQFAGRLAAYTVGRGNRMAREPMAENQANQANGADEGASDGAALHRANAQQSRVNRLERYRSNGDSSLMGTVVHKVCCICGCDLTHKIRFKDNSGKYWCSRCNDADHEHKRPSPCADCGTEVPHDQLIEVGGVLLCTTCDQGRRKGGTTLQYRHMVQAPRPRQVDTSIPMMPVVIALVAVLLCVGIILWIAM